MATWCEACHRFLPQQRQISARFHEQVAMFGVPVDPIETVDELGRYVAKVRPPYHLLKDIEPSQRDAVNTIIRRRLHTEAIPCTVVADRLGRVLEVYAGAPTVSDVGRWLMHEAGPSAF